jgi:hypothetical protein
MMRVVYICALVLVLGGPPIAGPDTAFRIQDGDADLCWSPDYEWPVPCDDEE